MFIVLVYVHVKPESIDMFKEATLENARNSVQEPGIARFDVVQQLDDPTKFVLVEVISHIRRPRQSTRRPHTTRNGARPSRI